MQVPSAEPLSPLELGAWRGMLRVHARLVRELDHELRQEHGLPLHAYEVLLVLEDAPEGRLRMSELADAVLLSQSGLTRLVDRLAEAGLVHRSRCEDDGRGLLAHVTPLGRARLEEARATHLGGVRERFLACLDEGELGALRAVWERVLPGATAE